MKDLRILWLGKNDQYKMSNYAKYLREELERQATVSSYGIGWGHPDIPNPRIWKRKERDAVKLVKIFKPDFIYIDLYADWLNLDKCGVPTGYFWSDPHGRLYWGGHGHIPFAIKSKLSVCLFPYIGDYPRRWGMQKLREHIPESTKFLHFPMAVDVDVFRDRGYERDIDICLLGRLSRRIYPLRTELNHYFRKQSKYTFHFRNRPKRNWKWSEENLKKHGQVARVSYAKLIARCKTWPFGCSIYKYALAKFVECMAMKTLVLSDLPVAAEQLHFIPDKTLVEINIENYKEKVAYYLAHDDERKKIVDEARRMVVKYHSTKVRAKQLIDYVEEELL